MIFRALAGQGVHMFVWDTVNNIGRVGDGANLTIQESIDNALAAEVDASANSTIVDVGLGWYYVPLLLAETDGHSLAFGGSSDTANTAIDPTVVITTNSKWGFADIAGANFDSQFALDQQESLAAVYAKMLELFTTERWPELTGAGQGTPTTAEALMMLYMQARNLLSDNRGTSEQVMSNDAGTPVAKASRGDDGTIFTRQKFADYS